MTVATGWKRHMVYGCAVRWAATRIRCPECNGLVDWRPGRDGRVWMRSHYKFGESTFKHCIEVFVSQQRDLTGYGLELATVPEGCQSLRRVSEMIKRRRGL